MEYAIKQLARIANVSVRTLHHYDEIGLLRPKREKRNNYRLYDSRDLLILQQILFFRELDLPLDKIKQIISSPSFDIKKALLEHKRLIELKKRRLTALAKTIDQTIINISKKNMDEKQLYDAFGDEDYKKYAHEVEKRWGQTEAYRQSQEKMRKMSKADMDRIKKEGEDLMRDIAAKMELGPKNTEVQSLIQKHYDNLRYFYEPNLEMYRCMANMYVDDQRFTAYFEKFATGLAGFMREAIFFFCDSRK